MYEAERQEFKIFKEDLTDVKKDVRDLYAVSNKSSEDIYDMKTNHLPHIEASLTALNVKQRIMGRVIGWGLAIIAILIAMFGIFVGIIEISR